MKNTYSKTVLRHINSHKVDDYLLRPSQRLSYPKSCRGIPDQGRCLEDVLGVGVSSIKTSEGKYEVVRVVIADPAMRTLYDKWFAPASQFDQSLMDQLTNMSMYSFRNKAKHPYGAQNIQEIQNLVRGKVIVGENLQKDLQLLGVKANNVIDIGSLYPHLPQRVLLKALAEDLLSLDIRKPKQYFSRDRQMYDRRSGGGFRGRGGRTAKATEERQNEPEPWQLSVIDARQDAIVSARIVCRHIERGSGTPIQVQAEQKTLSDINQILQQAEIDFKVVGLFLRGSRALGLQVETEGYCSDWDYVCVIDTPATVNSRLIQLHRIDISLFDRTTFEAYLRQNDLPMLELLFLPQKCQITNWFSKPMLYQESIKQSTRFHMAKSKRKVGYYKKLRQGKLETKQGSTQVEEWKILKALHLQTRFLSNAKQLIEWHEIREVNKQKPFWQEVRTAYQQKGFDKAQSQCFRKIKGMERDLYRSERRNYGDIPPAYSMFDNLSENTISAKRQAYRGGRFNSYRFHSTESTASLKARDVFQPKLTQDEEDDYGYRRGRRPDRYQHRMPYFITTNLQTQQLALLRFLHSQPLKLNFIQQQLEPSLSRMNMHSRTKRHNLEGYQMNAYYNSPCCKYSRAMNQEAEACIFVEEKSFLQSEERMFSELVAVGRKHIFEYCEAPSQFLENFDFHNYDVLQHSEGVDYILFNFKGYWVMCETSDYLRDRRNRSIYNRYDPTNRAAELMQRFGNCLPSESDQSMVFVWQIIERVNEDDQRCMQLQAARNMRTLQEQDPRSFGVKYKWKVNTPLEGMSLEKLLQECKTSPQASFKTYVLRDRKFNRIKVTGWEHLRNQWKQSLSLEGVMQVEDEVNTTLFRKIYRSIYLKGYSKLFNLNFPDLSHMIHRIQEYSDKIFENCQKRRHNLFGCRRSQPLKREGQYSVDIKYFERRYGQSPELFEGNMLALMSSIEAEDFALQYVKKCVKS